MQGYSHELFQIDKNLLISVNSKPDITHCLAKIITKSNDNTADSKCDDQKPQATVYTNYRIDRIKVCIFISKTEYQEIFMNYLIALNDITILNTLKYWFGIGIVPIGSEAF